MAVEPAETRHRERVGWDPPREAHADHEVGLDRGEERRDGAPPRGQENVEILWRTEHELTHRVAGAAASEDDAVRQQRDHLVPQLPHNRVETGQHLRDAGNDDDAHAHAPRRMRPPED